MQQTHRPIFVVGAPRSGTTLLQAMLMNLDGIWFPPETQFMTWTRMRAKWLGDPESTRAGEEPEP